MTPAQWAVSKHKPFVLVQEPLSPETMKKLVEERLGETPKLTAEAARLFPTDAGGLAMLYLRTLRQGVMSVEEVNADQQSQS